MFLSARAGGGRRDDRRRGTERTLVFVFGLLAAGPATLAAPPVDFSRDVLPILSDNCFRCHGPDEQHREAELRLDRETDAKHTRDGVTIIQPGNSAASELVRRLETADPDLVMPPRSSQRKLTAAQIALIKRWIDAGAVWGGHWAFQPLARPAVPAAAFADQARNPLDAFVFARLDALGLTPSPAAPRETLIRRVTLDLTGLPPTTEQVDDFVRDPAPDAYEALVDRLLASPAFGERMAWDWLDAARYADSNGYQGDGERTMWPWRDWVVDALNRNLAYSDFTLWQLAGDQLPDATFEQKLATGFCRNHMINGEGGRIAEENRVDYVMDMTETTGTVWLGLTFNCSRCHDHKFDPLTRKDYYRLFAFFNQTPVDGGGGNPQTPPNLEVATPAQQAELARLQQEAAAAGAALETFERAFFPREEGQTAAQSEKAANLPESLRNILKQPAGQRNRNQLTELEKHFEKDAADYLAVLRALRTAQDNRDNFSRSLPRVMIMQDRPEPRPTFLLEKGIYDKPGEPVTAAVPAMFSPLPPDAPPNRLALARWLLADEQPLTARVAVNRVWQQFFGVGLVKTAEDFGVQGETPVHPELLDWLAYEFRASGWDVKQLMRLIVTSGVYRQSSRATPALLERDPENRLLARGPRYRLPAWMIRDQALAVSGLLVDTVGGAPVKPYQPDGVWEDATFGNKRYQRDGGASLYRRSLYTFWRRIIAPTMFFDNASRQVCTVKQVRTNTPLHALATLNDVTYVEAARALAEAVLTSPDSTPAGRLARAFRRATARPPTERELSVLLASLERLRAQFSRDADAARRLLKVGESRRDERLDPVEHAAYAAVCNAILNLDEVLTKE